MAGAGMWKRQGYGKLFELPTTLWIPLCGTHFPTFSSLIPDYLKSNVRKILDTTDDLVDYMIDFNIGVSTTAKYEIKKIDTDYFNEE